MSLFTYPGQDSIPIPDPGNITENDVADTGGSVLEFLAGFPTLVAAVIAAFLLYKGWKNQAIRTMMIVVTVIRVSSLFERKTRTCPRVGDLDR